MWMKKVWILISWLHQKLADLNQHCFQERIKNFVTNNYAHNALIIFNMPLDSDTCGKNGVPYANPKFGVNPSSSYDFV